MRNSAQPDLDGYGDLLLDFLRSPSREQRNHLDLRVRDVRKGFDRQSTEGRNTPRNKKTNQQYQKKRLVEGEGDDSFDHALLCVQKIAQQENPARNDTIVWTKPFFDDGVLLNLFARLDGFAPEVRGRLLDQNE